MLCGLGLMLIRAAKKRDKRDMDKQTVFASDLKRNLSYRFKERLRLDVADSPSYFRDDNIGIGLLADAIHEVLDFICNMGYDLNGRAKVFTTPLFVQNVPINLAGCEV